MNIRHMSIQVILLLSACLMNVPVHAGLQEANEALAKKDYPSALNELQPLAEKGDAYAQFHLAELYSNGTGVAMDEKLAVSWYKKSAGQGYVAAQTMLGIMYENGAGTQKDYNKAASWYRKAAEQGDPVAQSLLGAMYAEGLGVAANLVQALKWFTLAANVGHAVGKENVRAIEPRMTNKQINQARKLVSQWQLSHPSTGKLQSN